MSLSQRTHINNSNHLIASARPTPDAVLRKLSMEAAAGRIRLPSLPDIANRVQKALDDPRAARSQITRVIAADAALAARIMTLANSAFMNPSSKPITDLQRALTQLGQQLVRCTAVSFSLQQLQLGSGDEALRPYSRDIWRNGALVASIAHVLARESGSVPPDVALMAGLMHNIGDLYIAISEPRRVTGADAWREMVEEWHPRIAAAILRHWHFPADIATAVGNQNLADDERGADGLTDVLVAAKALQACVFQRELLNDTVASGSAFIRLGLDADDCRQLLIVAGDHLKTLRTALTGT